MGKRKIFEYLIRYIPIRTMRVVLVFLVICLSAANLWAQENSVTYNSAFDEQAPVVSADGTALFFTISGHPNNAGGKKDLGDIWMTVRTEVGWSRPEPLISLNNSAYNAVIGLSADKRELYLYGHYQSDGSPADTQGISVSRWSGAGWSRPENTYIPYFINQSTGTGARLSADGKVLVYSAAAPTSYGAEDIYLSVLSNEGWSEPVHLGREVNSPYQEVSPFLSEDGKTLYFSTNRPGTNGSYDVFLSNRLDDSWRSWSAVRPLAGSLNTESRELYFATNGNWVLYTTTRDSDGYGDIRLTGLADTAKFTPPVVVAEEKPLPVPEKKPEPALEEARPDKGLVRIQGLVVSADSGSPIPATILVKALGTKTITADASGTFSVEVTKEEVVTLEADYKGFISKSEKVDAAQARRQILEVRIALQPALIGTVVTLSNVLFHQSSASLLSESFDELDMVANFLKLNPEIRIELSGHTDNRGDRTLNLRLSNERVKKVKGYLVSKGIEASRIQGKGYGGTKPVADNRTEEGRRLNRRVEFKIIK